MSAEGYKTLMVGSIKENDGKSTVTANIALNLARRGKKVVLVDCDMRHPSLSNHSDASCTYEIRRLRDLLEILP